MESLKEEDISNLLFISDFTESDNDGENDSDSEIIIKNEEFSNIYVYMKI